MHATLPALLATMFALACLWPQEPAAPAAPAPVAGKMDPKLLANLQWLAGTWVLKDGDATTEEHWRPLQGTTLLGTSHTYDAKTTRFFEFLRIQLERGTIAYVAQPGGAPPVSFPLVQCTDSTMVFENAAHDFPQRIRYAKTTAGMTATISRLDGSKAMEFVFTKRS